MPKQIDTIGTYVGTVLESGLGVTKKSNYPQAVWRLKAKKKFIEDAADIAHYTTQGVLAGEAGYIDYEAFDEEMLGYLVLFNSADKFIVDGPDKTVMMNYEQIQIATGWDGSSFDAFGDGSMVGKEVLFRVDENTFEGKTRLQINWVDAPDAPPQRVLRTLDADKIKAMNAKLVITKTAKPAVAKPAAAKPATPKVAAAPKSQPVASPTAAAVVAPAPVSASPASVTTAVKTPPGKKKAAATPPPAAPVAEESTGLPKETSQLDAWAAVCDRKGANEDAVVEEAWIAATGEIAADKGEGDITTTEWAKIRDIVLRDLAA